MWTKSFSKVVKNVRKEELWNRLVEINSWHEWVPNLDYCQLDAPFQAGSHFVLKPKGAPAVRVQLIDVKKGHSFTGCTRFFGAAMYDTYELDEGPQGARLTVTVKVQGPLGFLWRMLVAEKIANNLPLLMENLVRAASRPVVKKAKPEKAQRTASTSKKAKPKAKATKAEKTKPQVGTAQPKKAKGQPTATAKPKKASATAVKKVKTTKSKVVKAKTVKPKTVKPKVKPASPKPPKKAKLQIKKSASGLKKRVLKPAAVVSKKPKPKTS